MNATTVDAGPRDADSFAREYGEILDQPDADARHVAHALAGNMEGDVQHALRFLEWDDVDSAEQTLRRMLARAQGVARTLNGRGVDAGAAAAPDPPPEPTRNGRKVHYSPPEDGGEPGQLRKGESPCAVTGPVLVTGEPDGVTCKLCRKRC